MFQHLIVPVDGSDASWRAVPIAAEYAAAVDGTLDVVTVVDRLTDITPVKADLERTLERRNDLAVVPEFHVLSGDSVAAAIARHFERSTGAMIVMSSHGHGRSAAVLGSVTDELLRSTFGPLVVVGPHVGDGAARLGGSYVVAVDGSKAGARIAPIAEAWAVEFGGVPWVVEVVDPQVHADGIDVMESGYPARIAHEMQAISGHEVEFEVLHDAKPAHAIVEFAAGNDASLIFATTHGRSGMARLRLGSVAADIVRDAPCPVVLHRPPHLPEAE